MSKNQLWEKKEFLSLIKKITGNLNAYERYLKIKNNRESKDNTIPINDIEKMVEYLQDKLLKWENEKKRKDKKD